MATRKESPVYAIVHGTVDGKYGHVYVTVYELLGYGNGSFRITCQAGGDTGGERGTYAWRYGLENQFAVLELPAVRKGYLFMKRVANQLLKATTQPDYVSAKDFTEYALRILCAGQIRKVYVNPRVNGGYANLEDLPTFSPGKQRAQLLDAMRAVEQAVVGSV